MSEYDNNEGKKLPKKFVKKKSVKSFADEDEMFARKSLAKNRSHSFQELGENDYTEEEIELLKKYKRS